MATPTVQQTALLAALNNLQYELIPVPTIRNEARHLPDGARITITASPKMGIDRTIEATEELTRDGYTVIPHLTARQIRDTGHLSTIVNRLSIAGVNNVMVLAGDTTPPAGPFRSSLDLLESLISLGRPFTNIGISGYPEGHPLITSADLQRALLEKAEYATYVVTQLCFSANAVQSWLSDIRAHGIRHPVFIGVPGKVSQRKLIAVASRVGVGESLRFLRRNARSVFRLLTSTEYDPEVLIRSLEPTFAGPSGAPGFHVYTFNAIAATESWRQEFIQRIGS